MKIFTNELGHMTNVAAMLIYSKIYFFETNRTMTLCYEPGVTRKI